MAVSCLSCSRPLPVPPGVDEYQLIEVADAAGAGRKIEAIKRLRELTGWGLKEAKDFVDCPHALPPGTTPAAPRPPGAQPFGSVACSACGRDLPELAGATVPNLHAIAELIAERRLIEAIKLLREATNLGLKEAKDYIDCPHRVPPRMPAAPPPSGPAAPVCSRCGATLPDFEGVSAEVLGTVARHIGELNLNKAIKTLRDATRLGLKDAKAYVDCPHKKP